MESSFLIRSRKGIWAALVLAFVSTSAAIAEAPSKVLAAYLDPYGEGIVTVSDCSIIVTTAERHRSSVCGSQSGQDYGRSLAEYKGNLHS